MCVECPKILNVAESYHVLLEKGTARNTPLLQTELHLLYIKQRLKCLCYAYDANKFNPNLN